MKRALTLKNVWDKKNKVFEFNPNWAEVFNKPEQSGLWLIYGAEKQGKTTLALMIANYLRGFRRVLFVSGEEGLSSNFGKATVRAGLELPCHNLQFIDYISVDDLGVRLKKPGHPFIVFLDNATIYNEELVNGNLKKLLDSYPKILFVLLAHEERNLPHTSSAKLASKLAQIIIKVKGLNAVVSGRCTGGNIVIDESKAMLIHGTKALNNSLNPLLS